MEVKTRSRKSVIALVVLGLIALAGLACWVLQLTHGLTLTGMSNGVSWGLYIACFMFFVGLSAGGLIVASSASVFGIRDYKKVAIPAVLLSTVCILAAAAFILIDLGGIQRVFNLIIHPNFGSPLLWDVVVITLYLVINLIYLVLLRRGGEREGEANERKLALVSRFALPVAVLVHSVTAWIFGLQIAKAGWYSAIMAPLFVSSALDSGLALLIIVLVLLGVSGVFKTGPKLISSLAGLLAVCVAIDAFMVLCEVLTMAYPRAEAALVSTLLTGSSAPLFWLEIIGGLLVPFLLLVSSKARQSTALVVVASALVVVGVFLKRVWLLLTSFAPYNVAGAPGVTIGRSELAGADIWALSGQYAPTWVEGVIVCGVIALAVLLYVLAAPRLVGQARHEDAV
jgi:molybdopterin-containing oxidoreductase family membrane subunit